MGKNVKASIIIKLILLLVRQGTLREYLPPSNTQRPRPFQPQSTPEPDSSNDINSFIPGGYPPAGSITPQPPFPPYPNAQLQTGRPELEPPNEKPSFNGYQTERPQPGFSEGTVTTEGPGTTLGGSTGGGTTGDLLFYSRINKISDNLLLECFVYAEGK